MSQTAKDRHNNNVNECNDWSPEDDIQMLFALNDLKPVGVNRHFYVISIAERLSRVLSRDITSDHVWKNFKTYYNINKLNALHECLPFPNDDKEFSLAEMEFGVPMLKRRTFSQDWRRSSVSDTGPPSIIAVVTDNTNSRDKNYSSNKAATKELDRKSSTVKNLDIVKRPPKRTRGSISLELTSPSTTPPPTQNNKRRRI